MSKRRTRSNRTAKGKAPSPTSSGNPTSSPSTRCTAAESELRTQQVYDWIVQGYFGHEIAAKAGELWGIRDTQAREYIAKATERVREVGKARAETTLDTHLACRWAIYKAAWEAGDLKRAESMLRDIGRLQCLYATDRSLLAKAGLDESLTATLADPDERAAALLRRAREIRGDD